ncbi:MAG: contact-dependent growth inhibition system immunity protein [Candidatus Acidiferrum sp.]
MKDEHAERKKSFDPADYPALREFFPGYLHQDFGEEYGTPGEAVKGFLVEASGDEILQVKEEWKAFRRALQGWPFEEIQEALDRLGSAWMPENEAHLKEFDEILSHAEA